MPHHEVGLILPCEDSSWAPNSDVLLLSLQSWSLLVFDADKLILHVYTGVGQHVSLQDVKMWESTGKSPEETAGDAVFSRSQNMSNSQVLVRVVAVICKPKFGCVISGFMSGRSYGCGPQ